MNKITEALAELLLDPEFFETHMEYCARLERMSLPDIDPVPDPDEPDDPFEALLYREEKEALEARRDRLRRFGLIPDTE